MYHSHSISKQELDKIIHLNPLAKSSENIKSKMAQKKTFNSILCIKVIQIPNQKHTKKPAFIQIGWSRHDEMATKIGKNWPTSDKCPTKFCLRNGCSRWTGCRLPAGCSERKAWKMMGKNHLGTENDSNPLSEASNYLFQSRHQPWLQRGCNSSFPQVRESPRSLQDRGWLYSWLKGIPTIG